MTYCSGIYHGDVKKQIADSEKYCFYCKGRMEYEKKQKGIKLCNGLCKVAAVGLPIVASYIAPIIIDKFQNNEDFVSEEK